MFLNDHLSLFGVNEERNMDNVDLMSSITKKTALLINLNGLINGREV